MPKFIKKSGTEHQTNHKKNLGQNDFYFWIYNNIKSVIPAEKPDIIMEDYYNLQKASSSTYTVYLDTVYLYRTVEGSGLAESHRPLSGPRSSYRVSKCNSEGGEDVLMWC